MLASVTPPHESGDQRGLGVWICANLMGCIVERRDHGEGLLSDLAPKALLWRNKAQMIPNSRHQATNTTWQMFWANSAVDLVILGLREGEVPQNLKQRITCL